MQDNNLPKVSVAIPIYNVEKYLRECIDSILNQTYKNIEIVLVNDGSSDGSEKICQEYVEKHNNIKYIYQENKGPAVTRNVGLNNVTGDYIYMMDSDDYIDSKFIETSVKNALENNSDIVIVSTNIVKRPHIINCNLGLCTGWELFIKKDFLDKYPDIRFPEDIHPYEDAMFSHQLLCLTDKISINYDAIYYYRYVPTSIMNTFGKNVDRIYEMKLKCLDLLDKFHTRYNNHKLNKSVIHDMFFRMFIVQYWGFDFSKEQRKVLFEKSHNFIRKYKIEKQDFHTTLNKQILANIYISCTKWWQFEIFLIIIHIYRFFHKPFCKEINYYNA